MTAYELLWDSADERPAPGRRAGAPRDDHPDDRGLAAGVRRAPLTPTGAGSTAPARRATRPDAAAGHRTRRTLPPWDRREGPGRRGSGVGDQPQLGGAGHAAVVRAAPARCSRTTRCGASTQVALEPVAAALVGLGERQRRASRRRAGRRTRDVRPCTTCTSTSSGVSSPRETNARTCSTSPTCGESETPEDSTWSTRTPDQAPRTLALKAASRLAPAYSGPLRAHPARAAGP